MKPLSVLGVGIFHVVVPSLRGGGGREFLVEVDIHLDVAGDVDALRAREPAAAPGRAGRTGPVLVFAPLVDLQGLLLSPEISRERVGNFEPESSTFSKVQPLCNRFRLLI